MRKGNNAIKNEKAMAEALVVIEPPTILRQKKSATSYNGTPSKNGSVIFSARSAIFSPIFISRSK